MTTRRPVRIRWYALGLLLVAGCGLGDYEKLMKTEQDRVQVFDKEYKLLGPPLKMPVDRDPMKARPEEQPALLRMGVFLRPPRGFKDSAADKDKPVNPSGLPLYRYEGPNGYPLFLAGDSGTLAPEKFRQDVLAALTDYYQSVTKQPLAVPPEPALKTILKQPLPGRTLKPGAIKYQALVISEPGADPADPKEGPPRSSFLIYYHQAGKNQVALVYQVPRGTRTADNPGEEIKFSLQTLGVGPEKSAAQRKAYVERLAYFPGKKG